MAKPSLEDGYKYTMVDNKILEALARTYVRPDDWRVLIFIIRKTYGYHKKVDYIANSQIAKGTFLHKTTVSHSLKRLEQAKLITRNKKLIGLQPDSTQWKLKGFPTLDKESLPELPGFRDEKLEVFPTGLKELPTKVENPVVAQKKKETLTKERGKNLLSTDQRELFAILRKCPAIEDSDADKLPELLQDYPNTNHALEFKKFVEWWPGPKKRKKPWAVLRNWLERASKQVPELVDSGHYRDLNKVKE